MRRLIAVLSALCLLVCSLDAAPVHGLWPDGSHVTGTTYPLPTLNAPGNGLLVTASPTYAVSSTAASLIPTLPAGTHRFAFYVSEGNCNFGGSDVASDASSPFVASGTLSDWFDVATTTYALYQIGRNGDAPRVRFICK